MKDGHLLLTKNYLFHSQRVFLGFSVGWDRIIPKCTWFLGITFHSSQSFDYNLMAVDWELILIVVLSEIN